MKKQKTKGEIEYDIKVKDGVMRFQPVPKWKVPHTFHNSPTFMDYLHGDVEKGQSEVACLYEYARESRSMWQATELRDKKLRQGINAEKAAIEALEETGLKNNVTIWPKWADFLACESFPKKDWNELDVDEREQITRFYPTTKIRPLHMPDVQTLVDMGILAKFGAMVETAGPVVEVVPPGKIVKPIKHVLPILQQYENFYHMIFTLDFSKSEAQLVKEFKAWLRLPENRERLGKYRVQKIGTTGKALDRLKDLAAWRLYNELNNDVDAANKFANDHRKKLTNKSDKLKPFRDAKRRDADLFGEDADARKAKAAASNFLKEMMPMDFPPPPGPFLRATLDEIGKRG